MYRSKLVVVVLALVVAMSLSSCAKQPEAETQAAAPPPSPEMATPEPESAEPTAEPAAEPAAEMDADAVVEQVGAPVFEGATSDSVKVEDGKTMATFTTSAAYADVKNYYMGELEAPEWTNNGMEMGAMGGDEWEWKSADGTHLVLVKRDAGASETEIRFTIRPAA